MGKVEGRTIIIIRKEVGKVHGRTMAQERASASCVPPANWRSPAGQCLVRPVPISFLSWQNMRFKFIVTVVIEGTDVTGQPESAATVLRARFRIRTAGPDYESVSEMPVPLVEPKPQAARPNRSRAAPVAAASTQETSSIARRRIHPRIASDSESPPSEGCFAAHNLWCSESGDSSGIH